mmetsp:Transcript_17658/g.37268  ORF Transcript_17658/g.37268 Transcript_17658/m.37268 type:complete len:111 (-) Transcript_17658:796-1128(-)
MYKQVDCPRGHQLINSIGGVFFHDIQQCSACETNQYILSSNSSKYSCQACPTGAVCNGSALQGPVQGFMSCTAVLQDMRLGYRSVICALLATIVLATTVWRFDALQILSP